MITTQAFTENNNDENGSVLLKGFGKIITCIKTARAKHCYLKSFNVKVQMSVLVK